MTVHISKDDFTRSILKLGKPSDPPVKRTHVIACARVPVKKLPRGMIPPHMIEWLENKQELPHCCRHPERHDIISFKSHPGEAAPDIYVFICPEEHLLGYTKDDEEVWGEAHHTRFMVGGGDIRPVWDIK